MKYLFSSLTKRCLSQCQVAWTLLITVYIWLCCWSIGSLQYFTCDGLKHSLDQKSRDTSPSSLCALSAGPAYQTSLLHVFISAVNDFFIILSRHFVLYIISWLSSAFYPVSFPAVMMLSYPPLIFNISNKCWLLFHYVFKFDYFRHLLLLEIS